MDTTPLARGIQVARQPSPLERGQGYEKKQKKTYPRPLSKGEGAAAGRCLPNGMLHECTIDCFTSACSIQVARQPSPLERGQGYEKNRRKHTPDPFEKGRARRRVSAYPMGTTLLARGIQVVRQPSTHKRGCADAPLLFLMIFQDGSGLLQSISLSCWFSSLTFI